jgi:CDP-diglyceride synthetase
LALVYGVWTETGFWTALFAFLVAYALEIDALYIKMRLGKPLI